MFKKLLLIASPALLIFGLLVACGESQRNVGADGYRFGEPEYEVGESIVHLKRYDSYTDLARAAREQGLPEDVLEGIFGFSVIDTETAVCTIHTVDPKVRWRPEELGHELAHCFYGQWHTDNKTRE